MTQTRVIVLLGLIVLIGFALFIQQCGGQGKAEEGSPEWIVKMYFVQKDFPEMANYLSGEMSSRRSDPSFGSQVPDGFQVTYRQFADKDKAAIYALKIEDTSGSFNMYCYLRNEDGWAIEAVRGLAVPPFIYMLIDSLETVADLDDSARAELANLQLWIAPDIELFEYLKENLGTFDGLIRDYRDHRESELAEKLGTLNLARVYESGEHPGCIFVQIGGIVDNELGYLYAKDAGDIPEMTPDHYIYIEEIAPNWYLYKTT